MQVILTNDVDHLGYKNDVVDVRRGYWRNFLQPRGLAETATPAHMRELAESMERRRSVEARDSAEAAELKELLDRTTIAIPAHAGPQGKLFGSVGAADISRVLESTRKLRLDPKKVQLHEPLKALGAFRVPVDLGHGVKAELGVEVIEMKLSEAELARIVAAEKAAEEAAAMAAAAAEAAAAQAAAAPDGETTDAPDGDAASADTDDASAS